MNYLDLGYDSFLTRTILTAPTMSSIEARNAFPPSSISASSIIPAMNATTDIVFSSTDNDTAAWAEGTIYFANGTNSGVIVAGNTGNISATTYVYFDRNILGSLQTTTTVQNATGASKLLIAIIESGAVGKDCKITPIIAAGLTITNLTAASISGNQLDVIAAKTGTLDVDEYITLGADANVKIDGVNKRILINDGTNNRILIGYQSGGF